MMIVYKSSRSWEQQLKFVRYRKSQRAAVVMSKREITAALSHKQRVTQYAFLHTDILMFLESSENGVDNRTAFVRFNLIMQLSIISLYISITVTKGLCGANHGNKKNKLSNSSLSFCLEMAKFCVWNFPLLACQHCSFFSVRSLHCISQMV